MSSLVVLCRPWAWIVPNRRKSVVQVLHMVRYAHRRYGVSSTQTRRPVRRRADECKPGAGKGEDRCTWTGRAVYANWGQTRGRSGAYKPGGKWEGGAGVPAFRQHPALPTSFSCFILLRFSKIMTCAKKYFLFGQGFLVASLHTLSHLWQPVHIHTSLPMQAQQDSQGDQEDGHYTRTFWWLFYHQTWQLRD